MNAVGPAEPVKPYPGSRWYLLLGGHPELLNEAGDEIRRQEALAVEVARREAARQAAAAVAP